MLLENQQNNLDLNTPLTSKNQLVDFILSGCKSEQQIGIELELFLYNKQDMSTVQYIEENNGKSSIESLLKQLVLKNWIPQYEGSNILALHNNIGNISIEPAGQFEFSSNPAQNINELNVLLQKFFKSVIPVANKHSIGIFPMGINPKYSYQDLKIIPKERYHIMTEYYLEQQPNMSALAMMRTTATTQSNFDFSNEADLAKKMRITMALQPIIYALFANSPFMTSKPNKYLSNRANIWNNMDEYRSGLLDFVIDTPFTVEKYVDFALQAPIYFIQRKNKYYKMNKIVQFKDYLVGNYKCEDLVPTLEDFSNHLSTLFPDVRLKKYIEIRAADSCPPAMAIALSALFTGLLYDENAKMEISSYIFHWKYKDLQNFKLSATKNGLGDSLYGKPALDIVKDIVKISMLGLKNRGLQEEKYLTPLLELISSNKTMSEHLVDKFNNFEQNIDNVIRDISITSY